MKGDHCQLPPTIKSPQAEKGGLSVTLFERIIRDARFAAVVRLLDTQYRMNRRISDWASDTMYHGAIVSHPSVAEHTLRDIIGDGKGGPAQAGQGANEKSRDVGADDGGGSESDDELSDTVSALGAASLATPLPRAEEGEEVYPVLLLVDTSGLGMLEDSQNNENPGQQGQSQCHGEKKSSGGSSHRNFHEAELVKQHVLSLVRSGVILFVGLSLFR